MLRRLSLVASLFVVSNCFFPYVYHVRDHRVLVTGIDIDATLEIATAAEGTVRWLDAALAETAS